MKPSAIFLLITLDEIAIVIALILLIHYLTDLDWWIYGIIIAGLAAVIAIKFYIFYPQYKKPRTGKEGMIRLRGKVVESLNPEGQVKIRGEIWDAKSVDNGIDIGEEIEVLDTDGLKLLVRKVKGS